VGYMKLGYTLGYRTLKKYKRSAATVDRTRDL
jgi:hypothetical protein